MSWCDLKKKKNAVIKGNYLVSCVPVQLLFKSTFITVCVSYNRIISFMINNLGHVDVYVLGRNES